MDVSNPCHPLSLLDFNTMREEQVTLHKRLTRCIKYLTNTQSKVEQIITADLELAKKLYLTTRIAKASIVMRRAYKNQLYHEYIATAIFQLTALRIEANFCINDYNEEEGDDDGHDDDDTNGEGSSSSATSASLEEQQQVLESILSKLETFTGRTPSDAILMRKVARLANERESN